MFTTQHTAQRGARRGGDTAVARRWHGGGTAVAVNACLTSVLMAAYLGFQIDTMSNHLRVICDTGVSSSSQPLLYNCKGYVKLNFR